MKIDPCRLHSSRRVSYTFLYYIRHRFSILKYIIHYNESYKQILCYYFLHSTTLRQLTTYCVIISMFIEPFILIPINYFYLHTVPIDDHTTILSTHHKYTNILNTHNTKCTYIIQIE